MTLGRAASLMLVALGAAGCATTTTSEPQRVAAHADTAAEECRRMAARQPIVPAASEPRVGAPWWWPAPGAEPSRSAVKEGLRAASPCPLEQ